MSEIFGTREATRKAIGGRLWIAENASPLQLPQSPIGFAELIRLHRDVFEDAFPADAGHLRREPIDVAGDSCSAPENIAAHLADFCSQLSDQIQRVEANPYESEELFQAQVELVAWAHVKFLAIHPFIDGNGRTARLLLNIMLRRFGLFPVDIRLEDGYISHLRSALRHESAGLVALLTRLTFSAAEEFERAVATRERVARLRRRPRGTRR